MKKILSLAIFLFVFGGVLARPPKVARAIGLTGAKDTLQSSRISVHARVDSAGTTAGSSNVRVLGTSGADTAGDTAFSVTTNNLRVGDTLKIGSSANDYYTVVSVTDSTNFVVSPVLVAGDADNTDPIYFNSRPRHVITFTTVSAIPNGFFQILLPASATNHNNGKADNDGYDFNTSVTVGATDVGAYDFAPAQVLATASGAAGCTAPANYHCFEAHYSGSGSIGQQIAITIGNTNGLTTPIAPAPADTTEGTAETYTYFIKQFSNQANPNTAAAIDASSGKVAHIEAVRVTATVLPTISFSIAGVASAQTRCGVATDVTTTPVAVPFGTMALNTFKNAAHLLTVSTNASGGYVVTAAENDQLGKDGGTTPFIIDSLGNGGAMLESASAEWTTATINGFGFSLQNVTAAATPFLYTTATGNCTGTFCARQFADLQAAESVQTIMSSTTVANAEQTNVCYRLGVGATQAAGDYENQIIYTATGTF